LGLINQGALPMRGLGLDGASGRISMLGAVVCSDFCRRGTTRRLTISDASVCAVPELVAGPARDRGPVGTARPSSMLARPAPPRCCRSNPCLPVLSPPQPIPARSTPPHPSQPTPTSAHLCSPRCSATVCALLAPANPVPRVDMAPCPVSASLPRLRSRADVPTPSAPSRQYIPACSPTRRATQTARKIQAQADWRT
jgi:hypothetical protein